MQKPHAGIPAAGRPAVRLADNRRMSAVFDKPSLYQRTLPMLQGFDGLLAFAVFLLACAGLLIMYSSGYDHGSRFVDHGRNMLIAGGIMFVVAQIPPQRLMAFAVPLYVAGVALLVAVAIFGITKKGARRWLNVGVVIQPSEILKIAMPLMLAWWFQKREGQLRPLDFLVAGLLLVMPVGLIMKQPDLGTSLLVLAAGLAVIFFAGLSWKLILPPALLGLIGVFLVVWFEPQLCADGVRWPILHDYQQQRICTLLDPSRDPLGKGFHIIQGMIAIGSGGITGKGFMAGTQTHLEFIPERTTDFIFAAYSEEFGLLGNLLLIAGFIFLILRGLAIALEASTLFARLLAGALTMIFFTYAFVNMGMVSGILPVVGVPLPFISYGGTAMVTLGLAIGMLMSIAKAKRLVQS
jgi:rod shape determining protein RodA